MKGLPDHVVRGVRPVERTRRQIAHDFRALIDGGARLLPAGEARHDPAVLLGRRYLPRHAVALYDAVYYLTDFKLEDGLNFFVAFIVLLDQESKRTPAVYPRIIYKDSSLIWRVASHVIGADDGWIGKGDVRRERDADGERLVSDEDTSNLPYEIQGALDEISRRRRPGRDDDAVRLVLRNAPLHRVEPYADFNRPRRRAAARHPINRDRPVARITRRNDPGSLRFAPGFEPDFDRGRVEIQSSGSRLYAGAIRKHRILSRNRLVQYQFVDSPTHVWINPPQALTAEITSYGIRALHVRADEEIFVPGYEFHFVDDDVDPPEVDSQIPEGWAGKPSQLDPGRADASPWIERLPVIREFRARVLNSRRRTGAKGLP